MSTFDERRVDLLVDLVAEDVAVDAAACGPTGPTRLCPLHR
jgi:hypothetical protein